MSTEAKPARGTAEQKRWFEALRAHLKGNEDARLAFKRARDAGCADVNLVDFLYAYYKSPQLIFSPRGRQRDAALDGLRAVAGRLARTARATEKLLSSPWWKGQRVADLLRSSTLTLAGIGAMTNEPDRVSRVLVRGRFTPTFILELPATLETYAACLRWLGSELRRELSTRRVGPTVYLTQLVLYWQEVAGLPPAWKDVAALVEAARIAAGSEGRTADSDILRKNFTTFRRRNLSFYRDIQADLKAYVSTQHRQVSFVSWLLHRRKS